MPHGSKVRGSRGKRNTKQQHHHQQLTRSADADQHRLIQAIALSTELNKSTAASPNAALPAQAGDPPVNLNVPADRDAWVNMDPNRYMDLCEQAYMNGDFSYVQVALRANQHGLSEFINDRVTRGTTEVTNTEAFKMSQSAQVCRRVF